MLLLIILATIPPSGSFHVPPAPVTDARHENPKPAPGHPSPPVDADHATDMPGLRNVVAFAPGLLSGSTPEGEEGFNTLESMGVKTVISVDGARPDVEAAHRSGIRYVHLPIGYNGMDRQRTMEIARAIQVARERDPDAPVYLHCHHGKHRSAGALGAAVVTLGLATPDEATARMKTSGTAPHYTGLYQCVASASPASPRELRAIKANFPSVWKTSGMVKSMVEIDERYEHLKLIEAAGWKTPPDHPDLVPAAEAGRLADLYRDLKDDKRVRAKPRQFQDWIDSSHARAQSLEDGLTDNTTAPEELSRRFKAIAASCKECHARYRD